MIKMVETIEVQEIETEKYYIWIGEQPYFKNYKFIVEAYYKEKKGVRHLVHRFNQKPAVEEIIEILKQSYLSKRPYKLKQKCDGSINSPVLALFNSFCINNNLDPVEIYNLAYEEQTLTKEELELIVKFGEWQGVNYPVEWNNKAIKGLLESLGEINYHSLVSYLYEILN